jgi:hypothetical protein
MENMHHFVKSNPLETLDEKELDEWLQRHKKNLMLESLIELDEDEMDEDDMAEEEFYEFDEYDL